MTGLSEQKKRFFASVLPSRPNEWEVDEVFEHLAGLPDELRQILLSQVNVIWPVSHSLCFSYLTEGSVAIRHFPANLIPEWVRRILGLYEKKGLVGAREFMADVDKYFLGPMRGEAGVGLDEVSSILLPYIRGVSGLHLNLECAAMPGTDTMAIYLPEFLDQFMEREKNILLYKVLITFQWGHIASGIYREIFADEEIGRDRDPLARYPDRKLAVDLLAALQFRKVFGFLEAELPGLIRQGVELCHQLIQKIRPGGKEDARCKALQRLVLPVTGRYEDVGDAGSFTLLTDVYDGFTRLGGTYDLGPAALLLGEFNFQRAGETIRFRRKEEEQKFVAMLADFLGSHGKKTKLHDTENEKESTEAVLMDVITLLQPDPRQSSGIGKKQVLLDNEEMKIPEALAALSHNIINDLGKIPRAYVQAAAGMAGNGFNRHEISDHSETVPFCADTMYAYNEWDYRREGYRADWCTLEEKSLSPVRSGFVAGTLDKYKSQIKRLRRQFEMLRTSHRVVRRQRDGDDIDLDALIEALGDYRAGLVPSDRLFTRLLRDERDIMAMFLVDMSSSTEGWVGVALKETLVLLAEALEVVGDRYGIYGFSGMRRSRSELYHIKHPEESYGALVRQRIAAISPKEYTRMGPPIRHLTRRLLESQGKVRLLVVISDGKPEDYDDYKGQYAIEDTRKALLEAKGAGVHTFCITIDRSAGDYLMHMFGRGNYIFVRDVRSLPVKMVHMYRLLTSL
ncbi:MAG: hypothetical protein VR65_27805 [Desulfobulbaceae bacterium BRH_c16a]|nr:MAG: hypothetical protein VR65_27805 [Desulfobulbaceae bacterium BRH_c16a]